MHTLIDDSQQHLIFMQHALALAKRHSGLTADNPSVGCILVKDNYIIARGVTAQGGRPHAEQIALLQAGNQAKDATVYVTLEPCSHYGKTPPCAKALIEAKVKTVYIGIQDPDNRVQGQGIELLNQAGIIVHLGLLETQITDHHASFLVNVVKKRPFYTLKFAASLDGRINYYPNKVQKKISTDFQQRQAHQLRQRHHAIAIGINTIIDDNPSLDCRLNGLTHHSPDIIIFDRQCRISSQSIIFLQAHIYPNRRIFIFHQRNFTPKFHKKYVIYAPIADDFEKINQFLIAHHIYSVLVEGGATLQTAFLNANLYDRIIAYTGNMIIGEQAKAAFGTLNQTIFLNKK
jgi:diaminohydroxyphosphoribosylaminopyrimidine deaminase/5-amino-6-(5-phosphoribosylamino)uracil reductase